MPIKSYRERLGFIVKKHKKRGSPTLEESVGHIPIPQMFDELDKYMNEASEMIDHYMTFRNSGRRKTVVQVTNRLGSLKSYATLMRRYLNFINSTIPVAEDYLNNNLHKFKKALYIGDTEKAREIADNMGLNYDDFSQHQFKRKHALVREFSLSPQDAAMVRYGAKYPIVKGKLVDGYVCISLIDRSISILKNPNESKNKRTIYRVYGSICPQEWESEDFTKAKSISVGKIAAFVDGEKFQIHRIAKSTMTVVKKRQKDKSYVKEDVIEVASIGKRIK